MTGTEARALIRNWQKRNIEGFFCTGKEEAFNLISGLIPAHVSVGFSGSVTLGQLAVIERLEKRGNKIFNPYAPGLSRQESLLLRRQGAAADYYLASANALSASGELVFFSGYGNRTAGISYAEHVIIVCGANKITPDLAEALKRARQVATPLNCKRLKNWHTPCLEEGICREETCFYPEYQRMCCQVLIIEAETAPGRLKVILVNEELGF